jgi:hypothetical protein
MHALTGPKKGPHSNALRGYLAWTYNRAQSVIPQLAAKPHPRSITGPKRQVQRVVKLFAPLTDDRPHESTRY